MSSTSIRASVRTSRTSSGAIPSQSAEVTEKVKVVIAKYLVVSI
jgi:hypothetical protein